MGRRSKKDRPPAIVQQVFADNLRRLRDRKHWKLRSDTARNHKLAKDSDTTVSQLQRIIALKLAPGIDLVERIAIALDARPQDMLTAYYGVSVDVDPKQPGQGTASHEP